MRLLKKSLAKIPKRMRIKKGTKSYVEERGDELVPGAVTLAYFERMAGVLKTKGRLSKTLLNERSKDKGRGEHKL